MTGNPTNAMVCDTPYLQNEFGDPRFFYVFNLILSFSTCSQSFNKICAWEVLGANVLNCEVTDWLERVVLVLSTNHNVGKSKSKSIPQLMLSLTSASIFLTVSLLELWRGVL